MKKNWILITILLIFSIDSFAQDTLRLLNGNVLKVSIEKVDDREIYFMPFPANKKSFSIREKREVFSYTREGEEEIVVYKFNPDIGNIYKEQEMRDFITGERHAIKYYHSRFYNYLSFASGAASGYLVSEKDNLLAIATPLLFSSIIIIPGARVKKNELNEDLIKNPAYRDGYKRVAKGEKFIKSLMFGALGLASSMLYFELIDE